MFDVLIMYESRCSNSSVLNEYVLLFFLNVQVLRFSHSLSIFCFFFVVA